MSWNGLVISALARASKILEAEPEGTKYCFPVVNNQVMKCFLTFVPFGLFF